MPTVSELTSQQLGNTITNIRTWGGLAVNVISYGADSTGAKDSTSAIQSAITYAISIGKKEVYFPAGTYTYGVLTNTTGITFIGDGVTLSGTTNIKLTSLAALSADVVQRGLNVRSAPYNAVGDGIADDTAAFRTALADAQAQRKKLIISGKIRITDEILINNAIWLEGESLEQGNGGNITYSNAQIIFDNNEVDGSNNATKCCLRFKKNVGYALNNVKIKNIAFEHKSTTALNQHCIIVDAADFSYSNLENLFFRDMTGYAIDFINSPYCQNMNWKNLSFIFPGGCIGRSDGGTSLIVTMAILENFNLDGGINSISPQTDIWNFNGWRSLNINTLLTEGTLTAGSYNINGLNLGGDLVEADNLWFEFSSTKKLNNTIVINQQGVYRLSKISGIANASPLTITAGIVANVSLKNLSCFYDQLSTMFVNNALSEITIDGISQQNISLFPETSLGKSSFENMSSLYGTSLVVVDQPNELVLDSYSGGFFQTGKYLSLVAGLNVSEISMINDPANDEGRVVKILGTGLAFPQIEISCKIPAKYIGSMAVLAVRYYVDTLDTGITLQMFNGFSGVPTNYVMLNGTAKNVWSTGYLIINGVTGNFTTYASRSATDGAHGSSIYISAMELRVGKTLNAIRGKVDNTKQLLIFGTAVPTTGQWLKGDKIINSAPAVGSPKGWICTASGTPGTWVSEGNL